jgi:hypothetical protein
MTKDMHMHIHMHVHLHWWACMQAQAEPPVHIKTKHKTTHT